MTFETSADLSASASARGSESAFSGVSWGAIFAGGVVAAAMALILTSLGAGLGLLALSPWKVDQSSLAAVGIGTIIWSVIVEIVAFGLGGYVAGRLRTKWARLHGDEVYFRDTAHGFVVWALGTLLSAYLVTSAIGAVGHGAAVTAGAGAGAAGMLAARVADDGGPGMSKEGGGPVAYYADMMLRPAGTSGGAAPQAGSGMSVAGPQSDQQSHESREEVSRILVQGIAAGGISEPDKTYLAQLVSSRTGVSDADAQKRVNEVTNQFNSAADAAKQKAKEAADIARKALAGLTLWGFISMLIGAFAASYSASIGGRARDRY